MEGVRSILMDRRYVRLLASSSQLLSLPSWLRISIIIIVFSGNGWVCRAHFSWHTHRHIQTFAHFVFCYMCVMQSSCLPLYRRSNIHNMLSHLLNNVEQFVLVVVPIMFPFVCMNAVHLSNQFEHESNDKVIRLWFKQVHIECVCCSITFSMKMDWEHIGLREKSFLWA